jgi:hypothetical protein
MFRARQIVGGRAWRREPSMLTGRQSPQVVLDVSCDGPTDSRLSGLRPRVRSAIGGHNKSSKN